jgi:FKBP-type peptidyl-prolyl cis-trans isomerase (trigger factor)
VEGPQIETTDPKRLEVKQPNADPDKPLVDEEAESYEYITGTWVDAIGNYLIIQQENDNVAVVSFTYLNVAEGNGRGKIKGNQLAMQIQTVYRGMLTVKATVVDNVLQGQVKSMTNQGEVSVPIYYIRRY